MTVRMKDIARDLGISAMAVSKALRGHSDIGEETRARVTARAAELGYRVDHVARSMVTGRTFLVGLVVPDLMQSFFAEIAAALSSALAPAGYHVIIANSAEREADEVDEIDILVSRRVDGLVIASAQKSAARLKALTLPMVLIDRHIADLDVGFVGSDDDALGRMATRHLIERGCRRVAHIGGPPSSAAEGRRNGFVHAMREAGLSAGWIVEAGHDAEAGARAMADLLHGENAPDGVFCFNDPVAVGAMRAILESGRSIPGDIAVIGAANMRHSDMLAVPLSTIDQDTAAIGRAAAEMLTAAMAQPGRRDAQVRLLPLRLIARASTHR